MASMVQPKAIKHLVGYDKKVTIKETLINKSNHIVSILQYILFFCNWPNPSFGWDVTNYYDNLKTTVNVLCCRWFVFFIVLSVNIVCHLLKCHKLFIFHLSLFIFITYDYSLWIKNSSLQHCVEQESWVVDLCFMFSFILIYGWGKLPLPQSYEAICVIHSQQNQSIGSFRSKCKLI